MSKSVLKPAHGFLLALLVWVTLGLSGCATEDPENASLRPWNAPKSWESGLPSGINEGH